MAKDVKIPSLGESITEATILSWYKKKGEKVALDEPLLEVETDKISMEINAPAAGVVVSVAKEEGDTVSIGDVVATIDESASPTTEKTEERTLEPEPLEKKIEKSSPPKNGPAAEKAMREAGISADDMKDPTGKDGRVTKSDVERAIKDAKRPQSSQEKVEKPQEDEKGVSRKPMSALRKKIAERMVAAQQNAAILTTFNEVDMSEVLALREKYKDDFLETHGVKLGFMGFFVKACVYALKEIPALNAEIDGDDILYKDFVNMGVAVSTERGLVVPVVRDAHDMSFAGTEKAIHALAEKAREGKLAMTDLSGGTFTISNGGVFGSLLSTPIINPPQSGILGMHKIEKRAVVVNDEIQIRPMMYLALSYDHRIIDGKEAVTFLAHVKESLEDPERMLLEL